MEAEVHPEKSERVFLPVNLVSLTRGEKAREGWLMVGEEYDRGESMVAREAIIRIARGEKTRETPVVIKSYLGQTAEVQKDNRLTKARNRAYWAQLIYYEALRRAGVKVMPTFRLAVDQQGDVLGIVETNLNVRSLRQNAQPTGVTSSVPLGSFRTITISQPGFGYEKSGRDWVKTISGCLACSVHSGLGETIPNFSCQRFDLDGSYLTGEVEEVSRRSRSDRVPRL